jgi:Co/Zn/Cd efflux system component
MVSLYSFCVQAVERLVEPPEVKHERLLVVSILGFLVNMVGIFVFQVQSNASFTADPIIF